MLCPALTALSSSVGYFTGGEDITITGTRFLIEQDHNLTLCNISNQFVSVKNWINSTTIVCTTPAVEGPIVTSISIIYAGITQTNALDFTFYGTHSK
jgi:hypothetical protein